MVVKINTGCLPFFFFFFFASTDSHLVVLNRFWSAVKTRTLVIVSAQLRRHKRPKSAAEMLTKYESFREFKESKLT